MPARPASDGDDRRLSERSCALTRAVRPAATLLRFVVAPDGTLTPDLKRKLPGRGVWLTPTRQVFDRAARKNVFARALGRPVTVPADLADRIGALLEEQALSMLSLANKAGLVAPGSTRSFAALEEGLPVAAILEAREVAADSARRMRQAIRRIDAAGPGRGPALITNLTSAQIGLALGRADVIHAALLEGPASAAFLDRVARLKVWRTGGLPEAEMASVSGRSEVGLGPRSVLAPENDDEAPATAGGDDKRDDETGQPEGSGT